MTGTLDELTRAVADRAVDYCRERGLRPVPPRRRAFLWWAWTAPANGDYRQLAGYLDAASDAAGVGHSGASWACLVATVVGRARGETS